MTTSYSKFMAPTVLTASAATMFTVPVIPASTLFRGGRMRYTNTTAAATTVTVYAVPFGGAAALGNCILFAKTIAANDYLDFDLSILGAGDFYQALSGIASSVTATMLAGSYFS